MSTVNFVTSRRLLIAVAVLCGCGDDETSTTSSTATGGSGTTGAGTTSVGTTSAGTTSVGMTSAGTTSAGSTGSTTATTTEGTGSTGGANNVYPPCIFDPQPRCELPHDVCNVFGGGSAPHHCTFTCETAETCPLPTSGTATLVCELGAGPDDVCALDCSNGACPDEMSCIATGAGGNTRRCAYNP